MSIDSLKIATDLMDGRFDESALGTEHPFGVLGEFDFNEGRHCLMPTPETAEDFDDEDLEAEFAAVEIRIPVAKRGRPRKEMYDSEG